MILDLEKVSSETQPVAADEVVRFEDVDGHENRIACRIELTVRKIAEVFCIHVDLKGTFTTPCHRCLEPAQHLVEPSFDVVVRRTGPGSDAETGSGDEDLIFLPPGVDEISLDERIYESLIVSIPIQVVCKDNCEGLCSGCGVNLNFEKCSCAGEVDPRWEALRKLKDSNSD